MTAPTAPKCCRNTMIYLCRCVGFAAYYCDKCGRVIDRFECCGHIHSIEPEHVGEAAPAICRGCGASRMGGRPNGAGEGAMRESALGMARPRRGAA